MVPEQRIVRAKRIGLFSDVHGNLAGLQAVASALEHEGPLDHVVVAGDHLWGGPRPREVWRLLNERGWTLVLGNADENLVSPTVDQDFPPGNPYRSAAIRQREWFREQLDPSDLNALASLPMRHRIATLAGDLVVVHSSPRSTIDRCGGPHNSIVEVETAYSGTGASAIALWTLARRLRTADTLRAIAERSERRPADGWTPAGRLHHPERYTRRLDR
jgi:predicted phosphodiesterase